MGKVHIYLVYIITNLRSLHKLSESAQCILAIDRKIEIMSFIRSEVAIEHATLLKLHIRRCKS